MNKIIPLFLGLLLSSSVWADSTTGTTKATASISSSCTIQAGNVDFGEISLLVNYPALSKWNHIKSVTQPVSVLCSNKLAYKLSGMALNGSSRQMHGALYPNEMLYYNIYTNPDLNNGWFGDGATYGSYGTTTTISSTGTGAFKTHNLYFGVYGPKTAPGYFPPPDTYSDTYTLTLAF